VWQFLTRPDLLARWWAPRGLRISARRFDAAPGSAMVLEYREIGDAHGSAGVVGRADGRIVAVDAPDRLRFNLAARLPDGGIAFTGHYDIRLREDAGSTELEVRLRIADSTTLSADFIAGIPSAGASRSTRSSRPSPPTRPTSTPLT
jgi:uncharacterized protein YndB with AHSA1/START domain